MWLLIWLSVDSPLLRCCLWWDAHGVSRFCHSWWDTHGVQILSFLVGHTWSPDFVISFFAVESTVREGFGASCFSRHVWLCVCWLCDPPAVGRQALHPSRPSEEEGLHARPLPHFFGVYFLNVSAFFGGRGIGTISLPPHNVEEFSRGGENQAHLLRMGEGQAFSLTLTVRTTTTRWLRSAG